MEAVFFRLHERSINAVTRLLPQKARRVVEYASLVGGLCLLTSLVYLHTHFVHPQSGPSSCLPLALERAGVDPSKLHVLQIHLEHRRPHQTYISSPGCSAASGSGSDPSSLNEPSAEFKYYSVDGGSGRDAVGTASGLSTLRLEDPQTPAAQSVAEQQAPDGIAPSTSSGDHTLAHLDSKSGEKFSWRRLHNALLIMTQSRSVEKAVQPDHGAQICESSSRAVGSDGGTLSQMWSYLLRKVSVLSGRDQGGRNIDVEFPAWKPDSVYLYSLEKGFLLLRQDLRAQHSIVATNVTISVWDECLGPSVSKTMLEQFIGYDTAVMNWLIALYHGKGFLYSVSTKEVFNLNYAAEFADAKHLNTPIMFKIGVVLTTLFLFFTMTTLVSFTLRETQERMLKFTFLLQHYIRNRLPYAPLILTHVVESLVFVPIMVGILFFLFEFFSDQLLAFMVLTLVWMCEVYSVICVRTTTSIRFFPRVFFFHFTLFHIYFFSFPFGFSYLALITTVLFLIHSMLFFWNRCEVPALRFRLVTVNRPRMCGVLSIRALASIPGVDALMEEPTGLDVRLNMSQHSSDNQQQQNGGPVEPQVVLTASTDARLTAQTPALNAFPFSFWNLIRVNSAAQATAATAIPATAPAAATVVSPVTPRTDSEGARTPAIANTARRRPRPVTPVVNQVQEETEQPLQLDFRHTGDSSGSSCDGSEGHGGGISDDERSTGPLYSRHEIGGVRLRPPSRMRRRFDS